MKLLRPALLRLVVYFAVSMIAMANEAFIEGPVPAINVAPFKATVKFMCEVNTTSVAVGGVVWRIGGQLLFIEDTEIPSDKMITSTLSVEVTESYKSGVSIQCGVFLQSGSSSLIVSPTNASLTAYGTVLV